MKCSVSSLIQRGDTDGVRDSRLLMCAWLSVSSYGSIVRPFSPPLSRGGARSVAPDFQPRGAQLRFPDRPPSARQLLLRGGGVGRRFGLRYNGISARKGGTRRENCCSRRSFCFARTRKKSIICCLLFSSLLIFAVILEFILFSLLNEKVCVFLLYSLCRVGVCLACSGL